METVTQKKFSINVNQKEFLTDYKKWGFSDQSSILRETLDRFIREIRTRERKDLIKKKPMSYCLIMPMTKNSPSLEGQILWRHLDDKNRTGQSK